MKISKITIDQVKNAMEEFGYYAEESLIYDTWLALIDLENDEVYSGQDIYAICLEGPPGAGKSEFVKVYSKIAEKLLHEKVEVHKYQCDPTTSKEQLTEDIRVSAAVKGDYDNVDLPGVMSRAITAVNEGGKKVILFLDEYDKAKPATDAFFLDFLQDGICYGNQLGTLRIEEKHKSDFQTFFCKNDFRAELSGPLMRRLRIIRLENMKPSVFYSVAKAKLIDQRIDNEKVSETLVNLVCLIYEKIYKISSNFSRIPSCSEMLLAIQDADKLTRYSGAPNHIIYKTLLNGIFKEKENREIFDQNISKLLTSSDDKTFVNLIEGMKKIPKSSEVQASIVDLIARNILHSKMEEINKLSQEVTKASQDVSQKLAEIEAEKKKYMEEQLSSQGESITLADESLISSINAPRAIYNFVDERKNIKRGKTVFLSQSQRWTQIAEIKIPAFDNEKYSERLLEVADDLDVVVYEDGYSLKNEGKFKLIMVREFDELSKGTVFKFFSNSTIVPVTAIPDIFSALAVGEAIGDISKANIALSCLVYSDSDISGIKEISKIEDYPNTYKLVQNFSQYNNFSADIKSLINNIRNSAKINDVNTVYDMSKEKIDNFGDKGILERILR